MFDSRRSGLFPDCRPTGHTPASRSQTPPSTEGKRCGMTSFKGAIMQQRTTGVNSSEETIKIGPLQIRFLLTGDDANRSVSVFEVLVPVGDRAGAVHPPRRGAPLR